MARERSATSTCTDLTLRAVEAKSVAKASRRLDKFKLDSLNVPIPELGYCSCETSRTGREISADKEITL